MIPLPADFRVILDRSARRYRDGRVLVGGHPRRAIVLSEAGRRAVVALQTGGSGSAATRRLARRLVDVGLAHPRPALREQPPDVTVVIPVRDRPRELAGCLATLEPGIAVVVVDDGSRDGDTVAALARERGAAALRHHDAVGPAAARNAGLAASTTELVAFLDSDCVPSTGWLARLSVHFDDPLVGAAAPRIQPSPRAGAARLLDRFSAGRSPLDMGPDESRVSPGGLLAYVPSAALVVRRRALGRGFDRQLRHGEDVDLVWRMHDSGWRIRYDPSITVYHDEPRTWRAVLGRRLRYGTSAAPLSLRHPEKLTHLVLSPWSATAVTLLLAGHPRFALAVAAAPSVAVTRRLRRLGVPPATSLTSCAEGVVSSFLGVGRAATMLTLPALAVACLTRRGRALGLALLATPPLQQWLRRRPPLDPLRWTVACIADDAAYGLGVWLGCFEHRTARPLLPSIKRPH